MTSPFDASWWPPGILPVAVLLYGAILGSFLNVVVHRLPKMGGYGPARALVVPLPVLEPHGRDLGDHTVVQPLPVNSGYDLARPGSACPACGTAIAWHDNVPVLGWLLLRGRCRRCRTAISLRYPLVEMITAGGCLLVFHHFGPTVHALAWTAFFAATMVLFWIDVDTMMLPTGVTFPLLWGGLAWQALAGDPGGAILAAGAGYLGFRALEAVAFRMFRRDALGRGDAHLAAVLGAWLGPRPLTVALAGSFILGSVLGIVVEWVRQGYDTGATWRAVRDRQTRPFPFGPAMVLGGWLAMLTGDTLLRWYLEGLS
ncbi:MAG: A24 family peptidase [Candidatus Sericytochromatia bacterium]|nr:A24 family peptidase [Candidatus Sericytochromatia bacterium]